MITSSSCGPACTISAVPWLDWCCVGVAKDRHILGADRRDVVGLKAGRFDLRLSII